MRFFPALPGSIPERIRDIYMVCYLLEHRGCPGCPVKITGGAGIQDDDHAVFWIFRREKAHKGGLVLPVSVVYKSPVIGDLCGSCLSRYAVTRVIYAAGSAVFYNPRKAWWTALSVAGVQSVPLKRVCSGCSTSRPCCVKCSMKYGVTIRPLLAMAL